MMNTVGKFLDASGFKRGTNHPSIKSLIFKMIELKAQDNTLIDIISFFLYDGDSIRELLEEYKEKEYRLMLKYQANRTAEYWDKLLNIRNEGGTIELYYERLNTL